MLDSCGVFNALEQIASASGLSKEAALKGYMGDPLFKQVVVAAYDPFVTYGIKKLPEVTSNGEGVFAESTWRILEELAARKLTGKAAEVAVVREMMRMTPESRHLLERVILRDLRAGFSVSTINKVAPGTIYVFKCMLAHKFDPDRISEFPVGAEPKYDGVRALAVYKQGTVKLYSRTGKEFTNFDHITQVLAGLVHNNPRLPNRGSYVFDGELVSGEFRETVGDIHKKDAQATHTKFYAFDFVPFVLFTTDQKHPEFVYRKRRALLEEIVGKDSMGIVRVTPLRLCDTVQEILDYYDEVRREGLEGLIVKDLEGHYESKRSYNWLKIKDQQTLDLPVVDLVEGTGKYEGMLGALVVDHNGIRVNVGTGLSDAERQLWWPSSDLVGSIVEVEFHEVTPDGSLRHPRFVRVRDDKTLADGPGC